MVGVPVPSQYPHYQYQQQQQSQQPHISPSIPSLSTQQHTYPPPPPPSSYTLPSLMPRYSSISNLLNEKIQGYNNHHYTAPLAPFHRPSLVPLQSSTAITQQASAPSSSTITQIHPTSQPQLSATVSQPQTSEDILQYLDQGDLNLIASDLNNIVNNIMFELNFENKNIYDSTVMNTTDTDRSTSSTATSPLFPRALPGSIPRNIPFEYIKLRKSHEKLYLEEFYNDFANIILPFSSYDETSKAYFNPARDIILKSASNESFLLAAVLAQGAKLSFQKNKLAEDEEAYCNYLSKCLKLLGPALIINDEKNNDELTSNIEAVLLTVLLLTAANASNTKQDWRPHLKGAKDILMKTSTKKIQNSKILIFCKSWFVTLEILAGISSTKGGTLTYTEEIDSLLSSGDEYEVSVLKELGIILDNGFNIFGGYHNDCIDHLRELIKIKNKIRKEDKKNFNPQDSFDYMKLFSQFYRQSEIEFLNHKGILVEADFKDNIVPAGPLIDILSINNEKVIISWMDTCHQAYVYASMITILIECFKENYNSPQVQILTNKIISFVSFLQNSSAEVPQQKFKCAMMMIQWPMLVAGQNCITEDSKFILMKFFRMSAQIGSGGASFALKRITSIWKRREKNSTESESEDDKGLDLVSY
ncbi:fungal-specific transcription factor domain-containing protein [Scheffersomyces coipomensis]|uniref:fungal-specific transcription factor domain-containing protein n=1 Tax=Scheffersomyces coipomensis TaxID=1788519 RepID=UPI00315CCE2D